MSNEVIIENPNILKGSIYALVAFFCMAVFGILTKVALQGGSFLWVSFIAYLSGTMALTPYIIMKGFGYLESHHYYFLVGRAVFGTMASLCYTLSIQYIPIVNGTLLFNTAPIFIPLISLVFLKAKIEKSIWLAVLIGFIGIVVIIQPSAAIFTQTGNLIGVLSGISLAIAYLLMKMLTATDQGIRIIFYYLAIGTLIQLPLLFFAGPFLANESLLYAILSGLSLVAAQIALVNGYKYASACQIGIYQYATVVFVGLLDWLLWNQIPTLTDFIGIVLVALAGIVIIRSGRINHIIKH